MCCVSCESCRASKARENSHPSSSSNGSKRHFKLSVLLALMKMLLTNAPQQRSTGLAMSIPTKGPLGEPAVCATAGIAGQKRAPGSPPLVSCCCMCLRKMC